MAAFNPASVPVQPIASISPYTGKGWLKARVTDKGEIRTWNKPTSQGKLFGCTLVDESGAIRATFFNDACDTFFPQLQNGSVYYFGGSSCKNANRRFNNVNNEYELSMDRDAQIHAARDAANNIPSVRYNFVPVSSLQHKEKWSPVDVLAVVTKVTDATKIVSKKTNKEMVKRTFTIADTTAAVDVTLWEEQALEFAHPVGTILALRNCSVNTWDGVSLSTGKETVMDVNPNVADVNALQVWFRNTGGEGAQTLSVRQGTGAGGEFLRRGRGTLTQIESNNLGKGEKPDFVEAKVVPVHVKSDAVWYDACPECKKKMQVDAQTDADDLMRCEKCDGRKRPTARYLASVQVTDGVTSRWVTMFDDAGVAFFRMPADDLKKKQKENANTLSAVAQSRLHQPVVLTLRIKEDPMSPSDDKVKVTAVSCKDVVATGAERDTALVGECNKLLEQIALYHQ